MLLGSFVVLSTVLSSEAKAESYGVIPQSQLSLVWVDSEELVGENGAGRNAIDGKSNTIWHTVWSDGNPTHPHAIIIDLGATYEVGGFRYLPRQEEANGRVANYAFYVSEDTNEWGNPVATGKFDKKKTQKEVTFPGKTGRYVAFVALSEVNGNPWTTVAEINFLGTLVVANEPLPVEEPPVAGSQIYYVDPQGNDASGDGSLANPWKTLSHGCAMVTEAGSTIYVNSGSYVDGNTCNLDAGVKIEGAGKDLVSISTSVSPYIVASTNVPVINGGNEISGISFYGNGSNECVHSSGRSGQKIHDCSFENFSSAIELYGKYPIWRDVCSSSPSETTVYCDNDARMSTEPGATDWAENVEIYNNTVKNAKINAETVKGAKIHHNTIDNSGSLKSGVGHTALWWNGVEFHDNTIRMQTTAWSTIALEVWMVQGNSQFANNWTNGWFSILKNPNGPSVPYSWQIVNNTFESDVRSGIGSEASAPALETCFHVENVLIEGNVFKNIGSNKTYEHAIAIWGYGKNRNFLIRNNTIMNMNSDGIVIQSTDTHSELFDGDEIRIESNVFENLAEGESGGVIIANNSSSGDIDQVIVDNNEFTNVSYGVVFWPEPQTISANEFKYNVIRDGIGEVQDMGADFFNIEGNQVL